MALRPRFKSWQGSVSLSPAHCLFDLTILNNDGENIRLVLPTPTEERRKELVKVVGVKAEEARISVRNIRRESIRNLRDFEDEKMITEDDLHRGEERVQEITDDFIKKIDEFCERKEKEIMEV
jgi:ribosome recycling factor